MERIGKKNRLIASIQETPYHFIKFIQTKIIF